MKVTIDGQEELRRILSSLGERVTKRVLNNAGKRAAKMVADKATQLTPRAKKKNKRYANRPHLQDTMTVVSKTYRGALTVFVIGPRAGVSPHKHLVEKGTKQRFTGQRTVYSDVGSKLVKTKGGGYRTKRIRKGTGTRLTGGIRINRGVMPAAWFMRRAWTATKGAAKADIENAIRRGIASEMRRRFGVKVKAKDY